MSNRQNADAFDDLLGQLVDELAMTPTMPEEPEPEAPMPVPGGTTIGPAPMAPPGASMAAHHHVADVYPPPKSSAGVGIGIGAGIVVLGGVIAGMLILGKGDDEAKKSSAEDPPKVEAKADTKTDAPPPAPGATPPPPPVQPGQPGVVGDPNAVPGQPEAVPGQPGDPAAVGDPAATPPPPATPTKKKKAVKRTKPKSSSGGSSGSSKPAKTVNPFG